MSENFGEYKILIQAGYGGYGQVYLVEKEGDKTKTGYSLKTLEYDEKDITRNDKKLFNKEIDILKTLSAQSDNIFVPKLYAFHYCFDKDKKDEEENSNKIFKYNNDNRPYYVTDFYSRGSLANYIFFEKLSEKHAKVLFKKIVEGIKFLHKNKICHLDIKLDNIMLEKEYNPIIIDFGASENFEKLPKIKGIRGTQQYISPEMWEEGEYDGIKSDIFSLGVVLFNLVTGEFGFDEAKARDPNYIYIKMEYYEEYWSYFNNYELSKEFKELYINLVAYDPTKRYTIEQILSSDWLKDIKNIDEELNEEIKQKLNSIYKIINEKNEQFNNISKIIESGGYNTKGININENQGYFNSDIEPKKISNDRININHFLKINGDLNPIDFMNRLTKQIENNFKDKCDIEAAEKNLKFTVIFYSNTKNKLGDCTMDIELFQYEKGRYLLEFLLTRGAISDYIHYFLKLKEIIKIII